MSPEIYEKDGLRYVAPYDRVFEIRIKKRWAGKTIKQLFREYFTFLKDDRLIASLVKSNKLEVLKGKQRIGIDGKYIVSAGESLCMNTTSIENPIPMTSFKILLNTNELLAVVKPCGIPVHECVGHNFNTCIKILQSAEACELFPLHRLDKVTSGIVLFAKSSGMARKFELYQRQGRTEKTYLARVAGKFPAAEVEVDSHLSFSHSLGEVVIEKVTGRPSVTRVKMVKYLADCNESIVECIPITGRKHQIRVHLNSIGHPIANDEKYGGMYDADHPYAIRRLPTREGTSVITGGIFLYAYTYSAKLDDDTIINLTSEMPSWAESS